MSECKLKGFQQVLVRDEEDECWNKHIFDFYDETSESPYYCIGMMNYKHCIPYEGNEHLAGTSNAYIGFYEPKDGDFVTTVNGCVFITTGRKSAYKDRGTYIGAYVSMSRKGKITLNVSSKSHTALRCLRGKSTEEEKQLLISKLHEILKDWDAERKEIVSLERMNYFSEIWGFKPKDGDFIIAEPQSNFDKPILFIFHHHDEKNWIRTYAHCLIDGSEFDFMKKECSFSSDISPKYLCFGDEIETMKLATEEEKELLLSKLHEKGKDWCEEKKEIVDWKWKPSDDSKYYYVNSVFIADTATWTGNLLDEQRYKKGNCFRTHEEAQDMADKLNEAIINVK